MWFKVLEQDRLIERVRQLCAEDTRLDAALMYGCFTQGQADQWSDIEFWLFFAEDSLAHVDPDSWCAAVGRTLLTVWNEFGTKVAIFESLIRGEFHFAPASAIEAVAEWPARGAPVERMLISVVGVGGVRRLGLRTEPRDRTTARLIWS